MTKDEFDIIWEWLFDTRLRKFAMIWAIMVMATVALWVPMQSSINSEDRFTAGVCENASGNNYPDGTHDVDHGGRHGVCQSGELQIPMTWAPQLKTLPTWGLIAGAPWLLVGGNFLLLGSRPYIGAGRKKWKLSMTKKVLDERSRRVTAEKLSAKADRETARVQRQLEELERAPLEQFG